MRSKTTPTLAKWGLGGNQFVDALGAPNNPIAVLGWGWEFLDTTTKPIVTGAISPQRLLLPSKDVVDLRLYIIWSDNGNVTGADKKVGFLLGIEQQKMDFESYIGNIVTDRPDSWTPNANGADIDWKLSSWSEGDWSKKYPLMEWGIAYDKVLNQAVSAGKFHKTQIRMLRVSGSSIVADVNYSLRGLSESISNKYVVGAVYLYRMAGLPATAVLADGLYDGDGDGAKDTDNYADPIYIWGIIAEFQ